MEKYRFVYALVLSVLLLTGCGFHLRGSSGVELGARLPALAVEGVDIETGFGLELARALRANGVQITPLAGDQQPVLQLQPVQVSKQVLSVDREVRAREYSLISKVRFRLERGPGEVSSEIAAQARRDLVVDPNQVLGSELEERRLLREMEQELAQTVVLRLRLQSAK